MASITQGIHRFEIFPFASDAGDDHHSLVVCRKDGLSMRTSPHAALRS
jgi:hypothetical protein